MRLSSLGCHDPSFRRPSSITRSPDDPVHPPRTILFLLIQLFNLRFVTMMFSSINTRARSAEEALHAMDRYESHIPDVEMQLESRCIDNCQLSD